MEQGISKPFFVKHLCIIPPPYGGVTVHVKRLSLALYKKGMLSGAFSKGEPTGVPSELKHLFTNDHPKHLHSFWSLLEMPKLLRYFSEYQIIHNHYGVYTSFTLWMIHKVLRIPAVFTIHNQMIDKEFSCVNKLDRLCFKMLAKDPKVQIIAVNEIEKTALEERGYKYANPIKVIPAYIPPIEIGSPDDYLEAELVKFMEPDCPTILFYAESFAEYNGKDIYGAKTIIELFLSLKEEIANLRLIFCIANSGSDNSEMKRLEEMVTQKGYSSDVYWQIGPISEMWPLFKYCKALVRPTCTDGDSVMVREALAYGLPVVASDVTIRPEGCTVYEFGNDNDLLEKANAELLNPSKKYYPQPDYSEEVINVYQKLLSVK